MEVELSWLEVDPPASSATREPVLREEKIVWRKPRAGAAEDGPTTAPKPAATTSPTRGRPVVIRKAIPREEEPTGDTTRAAQTSSRRSKRPPPQPIPREEASDSKPPRRRHSKPPRR